jgi:hypothetical protein
VFLTGTPVLTVFAASAAVVVMSADGGTWLAVLAPGTITPVALADG